MYGVILLTVFVDLIIAVAVGVFIANLLTIERLTAAHADSVKAIRDPNAEELSRDEQTILKEQRKHLDFRIGRYTIFRTR